MKRAKIMLSAIAILAVVGGAFAFKAQRNVTVFTGTGGVCTIPLANHTTTSTGSVLINASLVSTTINCPATYTTFLP